MAFRAPKFVQIFQNEGVESLAANGEAHQETDQGHDEDVGADTGLIFVIVGNFLPKFPIGQGQITGLGQSSSLILGMSFMALRLHQYVGQW